MTCYPTDRLPSSEHLLDDLMAHHSAPGRDATGGLRAWLSAQLRDGLMTHLDPSDALVAARALPGFDACRTVDDLPALLRAEIARLEAGGEPAKDVLLRWQDAMFAHAAGSVRTLSGALAG